MSAADDILDQIEQKIGHTQEEELEGYDETFIAVLNQDGTVNISKPSVKLLAWITGRNDKFKDVALEKEYMMAFLNRVEELPFAMRMVENPLLIPKNCETKPYMTLMSAENGGAVSVPLCQA